MGLTFSPGSNSSGRRESERSACASRLWYARGSNSRAPRYARRVNNITYDAYRAIVARKYLFSLLRRERSYLNRVLSSSRMQIEHYLLVTVCTQTRFTSVFPDPCHPVRKRARTVYTYVHGTTRRRARSRAPGERRACLHRGTVSLGRGFRLDATPSPRPPPPPCPASAPFRPEWVSRGFVKSPSFAA